MDNERKKQIAIWDNCVIEKLRVLDNMNVPMVSVFQNYDRILIPGWVYSEVCDSKLRKKYVEGLQKAGYPIQIIYEKDYCKIVDEELTLIKLFMMASSSYKEIVGYFRREILKGKSEVEIDYFYEEWIEVVYDNWALPQHLVIDSEGNERMSKKNAGEISIAFLTYLLAYRLKENIEITIWSHDADCKKCLEVMQKEIKKKKYEQIFEKKPCFSYKNSDILIKELLDTGIISEIEAGDLIDNVHNDRKMIYVYHRYDGTNELRKEVVDKILFKELVMNNKIDFIW